MRNFFRIMVAVALAVVSIASIGGVAVAATGSISGYVTDNGTPILSAKVIAYDQDGMNAGEDLTDGTGYYSITGLLAGDYDLSASAVGYFTQWDSGGVSVPDGGVATADFSLTPGLTISGYVYQSDNVTPLQDIRVVSIDTLTDLQGEDGYSGADGSYSITVEPGSYRIRARTNGWAAEFWNNVSDEGLATPVVVSVSDITGIDFSLTETGYISGTVYNALTLQKMGSASVNAYENTAPYTYVYSGHAGASLGYYYINLDNETYRIKAEATGYVTQWWDNVSVPDGVSAISLAPSATPITVAGVENPGHDFYLMPVQAVTTNAATGISITSATLNGNLDSLGASTSDNVSFEWGLTTSYGYTTTAEAKTATGAFSAPLTALTASTTYHFRAKAVGDGTSYGDDATFTTSALGAPVVTTSAATSLATTTATLNGNLTDLGTASTVNVSFEWGLTDAYGATTTAEAKTAAGTFSANLTGLTAKTTYHFKAKAVSADGTDSGDDMTFTTSTIAPSVTTSAATSLATTTATLNGNLTALGTATTANVSFEWGLTTSYGSVTTAEAKTAIGTFSANLTGLAAKTTYHFRAIAVGDGTTNGDDATFTTSTTTPSVTTSAATSLAATSATLNGNLTALGTATTVNVSFEWGLTTSYGSVTTPEAKTAGTFSANLTGLTAKTTYHFRAKAVGDGSAVYGDDMTFATIDATAPVISVVNSTDITKTGATITWTTNEAADSQVEYGLTEEYGSATTLDANAVTSHSVALTGLKAGKTYHYRVISKDAANNQAVSADGTFKTTASSGGMPAWAWVIIGLAAVGALGGAAYFASTKMAQK